MNWIKAKARDRNVHRFLLFAQMLGALLVFYLCFTSGVFRIWGVAGCVIMTALMARDLFSKDQPCYCRCNCNNNPRSVRDACTTVPQEAPADYCPEVGR